MFLKGLKIIFFSKIFFFPPKKKDILIFDCIQKEIFLSFLKRKEIFVLSTRPDRVNEIFLYPELIFFILRNIFKRSLKINYLIAMIISINPKVIVTYTDNSLDFYIISKILGKKFKFLAVQNSYKRQHLFPIDYQRNTHIPNYVVFGEKIKNLYKKSSVKKFFNYGSLKLSIFLKRKKMIKKNKKFTICLLCEYPYLGVGSKPNSPDADIPQKLNNSFISSLDKLNLYTVKFCEKYNYNLVIAGKRFKNSKASLIEKKLFKESIKNFNYQIQPRVHKFSTYELISKSDFIIGCNSTMLLESLALKKKIMSCNFTKNKHFDFPFLSESNVLFKDDDFFKFEKKLNFLIKKKKQSYFNSMLRNNKKIIFDYKNTYKKLYKLIKRPQLLKYI